MKRFLFVLLAFGILYSITGVGGSYIIPIFWTSSNGYISANFQSTNIYLAGYGFSSMYSMFGPLYTNYPFIYAIDPSTGDSVNSAINLTCNVSDDNWLKNVSFYTNLSGNYQLDASVQVYGHYDSANYTITPSADFVWACEVCDVFGYCRLSQNQTILYDVTIPDVNLISPANDSTVVPGIYNLTCNASDPDNISSINLIVWKDGSLYNQNLTNFAGYHNNETVNFSLLLTVGNYVWQCYSNDTFNYTGYSDNYSLHVVNPSVPHILEAYVSPRLIINGSNVSLYINATGADLLYANVTLPNGTIVQLNLSNGSNVTFNNTFLVGRYNVTFIAEETLGNTSDTLDDYFLAVEPVNFTLIAKNNQWINEPVQLILSYDNTEYVNEFNTSGVINLTIPKWIYNMSIFTLSNKSIFNISGFNTSLDNLVYFGSDYSWSSLYIYGINISFVGTYYYNVSFNYSPLTVPLVFSKCDSFSFNGLSCSSWSSESPVLSGEYVTFSGNNYGEIGYKIEHYTEPPAPSEHKKRMDLHITTDGCVEDAVTFSVVDRKTGDPMGNVEVSVTGPDSYFKIFHDASFSYIFDRVGSYSVEASANKYRDEREHFRLASCYDCTDDSDCAENQICENNRCVDIDCDCGFIEDHSCKHYECCEDLDCATGYCHEHKCIECQLNDECKDDEMCNAAFECEKLDCGCGYPENHICVAYECCEDSECPSDHICKNHTCEYVTVELDAPSEVVEGDEVVIHVEINDEPAEGKTIEINGLKYLIGPNGDVNIKAGSNDMVISFVESSGIAKSKFVNVKKYLNIKILSNDFFKGIPVQILVVDNKDNPVNSNLTISTPNSEQISFTNVSSINFTPMYGGNYILNASSDGFLTDTDNFYVDSCELFNIDFGRWTIVLTLCWYAWLIILGTIIVSIIIYFYMKHKKSAIVREEDLRGVIDEI